MSLEYAADVGKGCVTAAMQEDEPRITVRCGEPFNFLCGIRVPLCMDVEYPVVLSGEIEYRDQCWRIGSGLEPV